MLEDARLGPNVRLLLDDLLGDFGRSLWVMMATIGIVLLIAGANVANILLVRVEGRAQEFAVRAALRVSRARIAREMFAESLALAVMGGCLGARFAFRHRQVGIEDYPCAATEVRTDFGRRNGPAVSLSEYRSWQASR